MKKDQDTNDMIRNISEKFREEIAILKNYISKLNNELRKKNIAPPAFIDYVELSNSKNTHQGKKGKLNLKKLWIILRTLVIG